MDGYIKLHRKLLENPIVCKDSDYLSVWIYLLLQATHKNRDALFGKERITLNAGQLITGRKKIATELKISESKVQRILKCFESEQQIEQRTNSQCRLISICSWNKYQQSEQQNEQQVNNERTTSEQQVNTKQECKNEKMKECKNIKKEIYKEKEPRKKFTPPTLEEIQAYIQEKNLNVDAQYFYEYFDTGNWIDSKGNKVKNWKQKCLTWSRMNGNNAIKDNRTENKETTPLCDKETARAIFGR